jgi:hypothetical protein
LIDDELELLWRGFADGVRIVVVSDSCHSGTVTKAMALSLDGNDQPRMVRVKTAPKSVLRRVYMANRAFYDRIQLATKVELTGRPSPLACTVRLLSGCMDGELSYDGEENGEFTAALLATWDFGRFRGNYASFHRAIVQRITTPQTPQHNVIGRHDPAFDAQRPFAIFDPTAHASRGTPATARTNSQRATRAIETYILDKRPEEIGMWRSRKPATDWGMNSPAWRGVANKIIGNFNTLDSAGAQIDPGDPGVGNAISNLHDEPLGSFHQYLTERADGVQISRRLVAIEADTREIA